MKFCDLLKNCCSDEVKSRGVGYVMGGRVRSVDSSGDEVYAKIRGGKLYEVWFSFEPEYENVVVVCTCEEGCGYGSVCQHAWALAHFLDSREYVFPEGVYRGVNCDEAELEDSHSASKRPASVPVSGWKHAAQQIQEAMVRHQQWSRAAPVPVERELRVEIPLHGRRWADELIFDLRVRQRLKSGEWGKWKAISTENRGEGLSDEDRLLALTLTGVARSNNDLVYGSGMRLTQQQALTLLPRICAAGKLFLAEDGDVSDVPLVWDEGPPWIFSVAIVPDGDGYRCQGEFSRDGETRALPEVMSLAAGLILWPERISRYQIMPGLEPWLSVLVERPTVELSAADVPAFLQELGKNFDLPPVRLPAELDVIQPLTLSGVKLALLQATLKDGKHIPARVLARYGDLDIPIRPRAAILTMPDGKQMGLRDRAAEEQAWQRLQELGAAEPSYFDRADAHVVIRAKRLGEIVATLSGEGWQVYAQEKLYRSASAFSVSVKSHIDWFDVQATCDFGGQTASLPALLRAARKQERWVELDDGTVGLLPDEWLAQWNPIASLGHMEEDVVRFRPSQAGLLDAWLMSQPEVDVDERFRQIRDRLASFGTVKAGAAPRGFQGTLRTYQKEGLGWFAFLQEFGFGGCLADDMGLGKTVQVLALFESRRTQRKRNQWPPSLVVVPRSLLFNWLDEARRFTPRLRILDHTGSQRELEDGWETNYDVVLTTYGTLRRDIAILKDHDFDYVVLDESQAIKNALAQTTKSVRLLRAQHRLAMSGTPIENHLGELWSLMEFLNPGLLGSSGRFSKTWGNDPEPEQREVLARAMRPFILRRTKAQVAAELPDRQEDTLHCELPPHQRQRYDELRDHYRASLLQKVSERGLGRSKIHVLEALLRLRQAACHPALISDCEDADADCAKFDVLLPRLEELIEEGHKALVFSQFTSYLALLKKRLDDRQIVYEYLDGQTRDRGACVERFQNDTAVPLFLISLKAGGLGLNLTAADYVFLLDPWWNPAVEAQAIDRAHRIGQINKVMAYRLIAGGTVEEKVLELQRSKRELADSILSEDKALIKNLTRDDLELLLSS